MRVYKLLPTARMLFRATRSNWLGIEHSFLSKYLPCYSWSTLLHVLNTQFLTFEIHNSGILAE
jgi:hypothetical protein